MGEERDADSGAEGSYADDDAPEHAALSLSQNVCVVLSGHAIGLTVRSRGSFSDVASAGRLPQRLPADKADLSEFRLSSDKNPIMRNEIYLEVLPQLLFVRGFLYVE